VTLLESDMDKMPLISLLEDVGNEVVLIHRAQIAKRRRTVFFFWRTLVLRICLFHIWFVFVWFV
jgi:hypothetical protein